MRLQKTHMSVRHDLNRGMKGKDGDMVVVPRGEAKAVLDITHAPAWSANGARFEKSKRARRQRNCWVFRSRRLSGKEIGLPVLSPVLR